jgi:hypothetical protein
MLGFTRAVCFCQEQELCSGHHLEQFHHEELQFKFLIRALFVLILSSQSLLEQFLQYFLEIFGFLLLSGLLQV